MIIDPKETPIGEFHRYMLASIAPRPIALVSSMDSEGRVNLSPYSNFNFFGANPPTLIFSPSRRVRDNTVKHTLENVQEVPEVVISIVDQPMVEQMSLSSSEYERGVNEFIKSGLTEVPSEKVRPPRVKESPVSFECMVTEVIPLGEGPGSGNLVVCEAVLMHARDSVLDVKGMVDPFKLDAVARMGGNWYVHAQGDRIFEVPKPGRESGIGFDSLPAELFEMGFTKNELARLAGIPELPGSSDTTGGSVDKDSLINSCRKYLEENRLEDAWKCLLPLIN